MIHFSRLRKTIRTALIALTIVLMAVVGRGQTTIASQDFEASPGSPTLTFTNSNGANSTGTNGASGLPASSNLFVSGTRGWQGINVTSTLTFANQSLSGYTNAFVDFRLAGMSVNGTNGIDGTDLVTVSISVDGGTTYSSELTIAASTANQRWDFTATGTTSMTYDGNNTPTAVTSSTGSGGISTVTINIPNANSQVRVRIAMLNNDANERWVIDDVRIRGTIACTAPTTQASAIAASSIATTSASYGFTRGDGTGGSIVTARLTATSNALPTSGSAYTANTIFGSGGTTGAGNSVIFNGTGNGASLATATQSLTGLTAGSQYTLTAYDFNTASICYNTATTGTVNFYTLSTAASGNPASFSASATNPTTIALTFPASSTVSATGYLIFQRTGNTATTFVPSNATAYTTSTLYGNGTLVANVSAANTSIGSLTASTQYTYTIVPYTWDASNAATYNYFTTSNLTATATTPALAAPTVNTPTSASIVNTTATLGGNVTSDGGSAVTARGIVWATNANNSNPTIGGASTTNVVGTGTTGVFTVNITGLPANTVIAYRAYATNAQGTTYTTATTFTTLQVASKIVFGTAPPTTGSVAANLTTFTIVAQRPDNSTDAEYTGLVTLSRTIVSGSATLTGNTANAIAGVATFSTAQFDAVGTYTIAGTSGALTATGSSSNIVITFTNANITAWTESGSATAWHTSGNWTPSTVPTGSVVAQWNNTGSATQCGINIGTGAPTILGIEMSSARTRALLIGGSGSTSGNLTLNSGTINSVANVILRNNSTSLLTIAQTQSNSSVLTLRMGNNGNNVVNIDGTGGITITSDLSGASSATIVKAGAGTGDLTFVAPNSYSGKTVINTGYIAADGESAFGTAPVAFTADQITLNGGGIKTTGSSNINFIGNRGITLGASGGLFSPNGNAITLTNAVAGSGALTVASAGSLSYPLGTTHTYTGLTTLTAGTTTLSQAQCIPSTNNITLNGGTLVVATNQTLNNVTLTSGTLTVNNGVTLTINGTFTYTSGTISSTGTIVYGGSSTLTYNATKTAGIEWTASNTPAAVNITAGNLTLANNATTSGNLTVSGTAVLTGTGFNLTVGGDWSVASTGGYTGSTNASSLVTLNGSGVRTFTHTGGATFRNLTISGTGTYTSNNDINMSVNTCTISSGSLDMGTNSLNGSGSLTMSGGTLKLGKLNTTLPELSVTVNGLTGGTIELNGAGAQTLSGSPTYYNLTISGSGAKTPTSGAGVAATLTITGSTILDASTSAVGGTGTNLTMTGTSRFIVAGSSTKPAASGTYNLANTSTIQFAGSSASTIRQSPTYGNIDISGTNVTAPSSGLTLQTGSTFNVTSTGVLFVGSTNGLYATNNAAVLNTNTPSVTLQTGSTVNYNLAGAQTITNTPSTYSNLTISNSGAKTPAGAFTVNGTFNRTGDASLATTSPTYGGSSTLAYVDATDSRTYTAGAEWSNTSSPTNVTINLSGTGSRTVTLPGDRSVSGALTLTAGRLSIASNTLTLNGTVSGMSASNSLVGSTSSKLTVTSTSSVGNVFFDQTTSADAATTNGTNALQNLVVSGSGSTTLGNKVNLFERLSVTAGTLTTGDSLVLRSVAGTSSNNTAYVDVVGGTINGQARVERYVHKTTRGWRAITAPVTYNGIGQGYVKSNWQNSWGLSNNYGTRITGPAGGIGLDDTTASASLMTYNSTSGAWNRISNTTTETVAGNAGGTTADNKSFFLFVRGDRTVKPNGYNPNAFQATTLAARGKLQTGQKIFNFSGAANKAWLIGNPYACAVNMDSVTFGGSVPNNVYVWDPNLTASYDDVTGNYVTFQRSNWDAGAPGSSITKYFQSGQCFFIVPTTTTASVTFNENNKIGVIQNNQTSGVSNGLSDIFNITLLNVKTDGTRSTIDGTRAKFGAGYSAGLDAEDAYKWSSAGIENMSLSRNNALLVIEARPYITSNDTLFLNITNLAISSNYEFKINPINFDASVSGCKLVDKFLNTETPISLNSNTNVGFNVTSVTGSNAANRFYVVFNAAGNLPTNNSLTVKAYKQNNAIKVDWEAIAENNVKGYEVEKSTDANSFGALINSETTAKNGSTTNAYSFTDNNPVMGVNYYRILSTQTNNNKVYSVIVRVEMTDKGIKSVTVYPNPVKSNSNAIGLQMNNLTAGKYTARLYNAAGQEVYTSILNHNGSNGSTSLSINKTLAAGSYQLQLTDTKGNSYQQGLMVVE